MICKSCAVVIEPLADFPGPLCLSCYAPSPAGRAPITADQLTAMWGGPARRRKTARR